MYKLLIHYPLYSRRYLKIVTFTVAQLRVTVLYYQSKNLGKLENCLKFTPNIPS